MYTISRERFAGLNILDFISMKFSQEYFHGDSTVYYLTIAKYLWEIFAVHSKIGKM